MGEAEFEYVIGQGRPTFPTLLQSYEAASTTLRKRDGVDLDIRYGPHPRQTFDFFPAAGRAIGTIVYFHAGYWQSRDKQQFAFLAGPYNGSGIHCALVNYPLCPSVTVPQIVGAVADSLPAIAARVGGPKLVLAGHSAGAHLAVELALAAPDITSIAGVVGLSGVYDLRPLVGTTLNGALQLDAARAAHATPLQRLRSGLPRAIFAVGGAETGSFIQQSRRIDALWNAAGNSSKFELCQEKDHFSVLQDFINPTHPLYRGVVSLVALNE